MPKYTVVFYAGDYGKRQRLANEDSADVYIEQHFNSCSSPDPSYTAVLVAHNASRRSVEMADFYSNLVEERLGIPQGGQDGVIQCQQGDRGNSNLAFTDMPAILLETLFVSNPDAAGIVVSPEGREELAQILVDTIVSFFPDGGKIAFSVGHKYKDSRPNDRGAAVCGDDPDPNDGLDHVEADYAEDVLRLAAEKLEAIV